MTATLDRPGQKPTAIRKDEESNWEPAGHYDPEFKDAVVSELQRLATLPPNWDSYGAPAINPQIISAATKFVRSLQENVAYRPNVVPMSAGNLQFEWHHGDKVLELEFETPYTIRYLQWDPAANVQEEDAFNAGEVERAVDLIHWFMAGTCTA